MKKWIDLFASVTYSFFMTTTLLSFISYNIRGDRGLELPPLRVLVSPGEPLYLKEEVSEEFLKETIDSLPIHFGSLRRPSIKIFREPIERAWKVVVLFDEAERLKDSLESLIYYFGKSTLQSIREAISESFEIESPYLSHFIAEIVAKPYLIGASYQVYGDKISDLYKTSLEKFQTEYRRLMDVSPILNNRRVVILSSVIKGGHEALARTLQKALEIRHFETQIVYTDQSSVDYLEEMGVRYQGSLLSSEFYRGEFAIGGGNPLIETILFQTKQHICRYYPGSRWELSLEKILDFAPGIIVSTAAHLQKDHLQISSLLGRPLNLFFSDYKLDESIKDPSLRKFERNFFVPVENPALLPILYTCGNADMFFSFKDDGNPFTLGELHPVGNFADPLYFRIFTDEARLEIKSKYGVLAEKKVILVTFGSVPHKLSLLTVCQKLADPSTRSSIELPYQVIVVCGPNEDLLASVRALAADFIVFSTIAQEEMADLFAIADSVIGKPGGAVTAQIEASGADLVGYAMYSWELPNMSYLKMKGLGGVIRSCAGVEDFATPIKASFERSFARRKSGYHPPPSVMDHIDEILSLKTFCVFDRIG